MNGCFMLTWKITHKEIKIDCFVPTNLFQEFINKIFLKLLPSFANGKVVEFDKQDPWNLIYFWTQKQQHCNLFLLCRNQTACSRRL